MAAQMGLSETAKESMRNEFMTIIDKYTPNPQGYDSFSRPGTTFGEEEYPKGTKYAVVRANEM